MKHRFLTSIGVVAVITVMSLSLTTVLGQAPTANPKTGTATNTTAPPVKTIWGEPDLQGIWTDDYQIPLQRPAKFAGKAFFTEAELAELDRQRAAILRRDYRAARGTEADVGGAYNAVFISVKHTGRRTSLIVDPPDGRIPAMTPAAAKMRSDVREFQLALLQATQLCKQNQAGPGTPVRNGVAGGASCAGGQYGAPSPRRFDRAPYYVTAGLNRADGPEDRNLSERCMSAQLPDFSGFRRIVQSPGQVSMFYDVGQGQGWQRNIVMNGSPHLPVGIRQWYGDSRGHWEGDTLVIDVTNFSPKTDVQGSRENLHLVERWTRTGPAALEYVVTIEDPTVWTRPWIVKQEFTRQSEQENRIYYEPRCIEGNYAFPAMMLASRVEDLAFAEGRGPNPATKDNATDFVGVEQDPFQ